MFETFNSDRTKLAVFTLASIGFQIYRLVATGQDVPSVLILGGVSVVVAWITGDTIRPTKQSRLVKPDEVAS
jgi:hypothetical protein